MGSPFGSDARDRYGSLGGTGASGGFGGTRESGGFGRTGDSAFGGGGVSAGDAAAAAASAWVAGYDWVIENLKRDHPSVSSELAICKALEHMNHRQFERAIDELKAFERKDVRLKARAATNLSFLYFLEGVRPSAASTAPAAVVCWRVAAAAGLLRQLLG